MSNDKDLSELKLDPRSPNAPKGVDQVAPEHRESFVKYVEGRINRTSEILEIPSAFTLQSVKLPIILEPNDPLSRDIEMAQKGVVKIGGIRDGLTKEAKLIYGNRFYNTIKEETIQVTPARSERIYLIAVEFAKIALLEDGKLPKYVVKKCSELINLLVERSKIYGILMPFVKFEIPPLDKKYSPAHRVRRVIVNFSLIPSVKLIQQASKWKEFIGNDDVIHQECLRQVLNSIVGENVFIDEGAEPSKSMDWTNFPEHKKGKIK